MHNTKINAGTRKMLEIGTNGNESNRTITRKSMNEKTEKKTKEREAIVQWFNKGTEQTIALILYTIVAWRRQYSYLKLRFFNCK